MLDWSSSKTVLCKSTYGGANPPSSSKNVLTIRFYFVYLFIDDRTNDKIGKAKNGRDPAG